MPVQNGIFQRVEFVVDDDAGGVLDPVDDPRLQRCVDFGPWNGSGRYAKYLAQLHLQSGFNGPNFHAL